MPILLLVYDGFLKLLGFFDFLILQFDWSNYSLAHRAVAATFLLAGCGFSITSVKAGGALYRAGRLVFIITSRHDLNATP